MASVEKRTRNDRTRWYVRYRDPGGEQRTKTFDRRVDAERYLTTIESSKLSGSYVDPARSRITVGEWTDRWLAGQAHLKPTTRERYAGIVRKHIRPRWATTTLADVTHADVQSWVTKVSRSAEPATVRKIHRVLSLILTLAVKDGRLIRNPAADINLPRPRALEQRYLTHEQVHDLARAATGPVSPSKHRRPDERQSDQYRLIVLFLAYTGVRFGEMAALRVRRVDFLRRRATIAESVTLVGAQQVWGTPKGHERREVPIPRFLVDQLAEHVKGKAPDDLVFSGVRGGGALRAPIFRRAAFDRAAEEIGMPGLHPHELRHTAASLAIAAGADIKVVQKMLGHKSATMTLDQYGHLFDDRLDDVADRLDAAAGLYMDSNENRRDNVRSLPS
jgi:integrase